MMFFDFSYMPDRGRWIPRGTERFICPSRAVAEVTHEVTGAALQDVLFVKIAIYE